MSEKGPFTVGQEVIVTYRARVAEVVTGRAYQVGELFLRLEAVSAAHPSIGWVNPDDVSIEVVEEPVSI